MLLVLLKRQCVSLFFINLGEQKLCLFVDLELTMKSILLFYRSKRQKNGV